MKSLGRSRTVRSIATMAIVCIASLSACDGFARIGVLDGGASILDDDGGRDAGGGSRVVDGCGPDNAARLSPSEIMALKAASEIAPGQRTLYPYDGTVFPAGMGAPTVMWAGPIADAVLLQLDSARFHYLGCLLPESEGRLTIPEAVWEQAGSESGGSRDPFRMRLSILTSGRVTGPMERTFTIASDAVQATLHYMSYRETGVPTIVRLRSGRTAEPLFAGLDCAGCHAVTAGGTTLMGHFAGSGSAFRLGAGDAAPVLIGAQRVGAEHAALHPRGDLYVATAHPRGMGTRFFSTPSLEANLFSVATGATVAGSNIPPGAMLPAFSRSGALLAFNDAAIDGGRGLAVVDFDVDTATAANYREVFRDDGAYPGWPSFTPDERALVFARGQTADFSSMGAGFPSGVLGGSPSDLYLIALQGTEESMLLARAMGFAEPTGRDEDTYLPFGSQDLHRNYHPRVAPVASSEYAWVYFDSLRNYGNYGRIRQIWGAAIERATGAVDRSHPPFYVVGQEVGRLNLKAVAVEE